eukprot:403356730
MYDNNYGYQSVIHEETSLMANSVNQDDFLIEQALMDMDISNLVQDPSAKRTMLMKPKRRNQQTKNESKFRINSATTRRTLNAISTANDESRMMNFIQSENYEINSFRSNHDKSNSQQQANNTQSVEAIRQSWNRQQNSQIKSKEFNSSFFEGMNQGNAAQDKMNVTMDNIRSSNQIETGNQKGLSGN